MVKMIKVEELIPSLYVIDVSNTWNKYLSLNRKSYICNEELVRIFRQSGMEKIYVDTAKSKVVLDEIKPAVVPKAKISFQEEFKKSELIYTQAKSAVTEILTDIKQGNKQVINKANDTVLSIIDGILLNKYVLVGLGLMRQKSSYIFEHAVSSCVQMIAFAAEYGFDKDKQIELGVGAMLQDIGMLNIPSQILNKPGRLSSRDEMEIRKHVDYGCSILEDIPGIAESTLLMSGEHHERLNGSGYPNSKKNDEISKVGKMAAIVDVYNAVTTDRGYKKGLSPSIALADILSRAKNHFDAELVQTFIKAIGIYPFGTLLSLTNSLIGLVVNPNNDDLLHPGLLIIYNPIQGGLIKPYSLRLVNHQDDPRYRISRVVAKEELLLRQEDIYKMVSATSF